VIERVGAFHAARRKQRRCASFSDDRPFQPREAKPRTSIKFKGNHDEPAEQPQAREQPYGIGSERPTMPRGWAASSPGSASACRQRRLADQDRVCVGDRGGPLLHS